MNERPIAVTDRYRRALSDAASWHRHQFRKASRIPYISHLLTVSALVMEDGGSEDEAIAGLLHDSIEDTGVTVAVIDAGYGARVAGIVNACTDDAGGDAAHKAPWWLRKVEHIDKVAAAGRDASGVSDVGVARVTAADKLANLRSTLDSGDDDVFLRFKAGLGGFAWYQETFGRVLIGQLGPRSVLSHQLGQGLDRLDAFIDERRRQLGATLAATTERLVGFGVPVGSHSYNPWPWFALDVVHRSAGNRPSAETVIACWASWFDQPLPTNDSSERASALGRVGHMAACRAVLVALALV